MSGIDTPVSRVAISLAIGLLIGVERERRKGQERKRGTAGIRTFALVALCGGLSRALGVPALLVASAVFVTLLAAVSYAARRTEPGLTTETALLTAYLLGALALSEPVFASGLAVTVTILLAARERLHRFVRRVITPEELHDALLLFAAAVVLLPLMPDRGLGPYGAFNPRFVWKLVVLMMAVSSVGYIAVRSLGARFGLPAAGLAAGFVSSAAAVASMGALSRKEESMRRPAVAGALLSTVSSTVELGIVLAATSRAVLSLLLVPLALAIGVAVAYAGLFAWRAVRQPDVPERHPRRPFDIRMSLLFGAVISAAIFASTFMTERFGSSALLLASVATGFVDSHAATISVGRLAAGGGIPVEAAVLPILAAVTANTATKVVLAFTSGGPRFALPLAPGLLLMLAAAWAGALRLLAG